MKKLLFLATSIMIFMSSCTHQDVDELNSPSGVVFLIVVVFVIIAGLIGWNNANKNK